MTALKPSLADKLKSLGVKVGTTHLSPPQPASRFPIHDSVPGEYRSTRRGDVFVAQERFTKKYKHGQSLIFPASDFSLLAQWAKDARVSEIALNQFAFLDTETSGISGGTGTYAFLIGAARFVDGEFVVAQFFMRDPAEEAAALEGLADFLAPCKALVTFNGKSFDAPLLVTRFSLHNIPVPFKGYAHVDLLPLARRLWRDRLPSRALKYLEEHVLGLVRTTDEVPGYEIPWLYFDYLRTGDARPLKGVFYHNAMDVVAMAALLTHVIEMMNNPYGGHVEHGLDFIALGKLFEDLGHWDDAARLLERGIESGLDEADFGVAAKRLSALQKKRGDLDQAIKLWKRAAAGGHIYAFVELAKYYEHKARESQEALKWARKAQAQIAKNEMPAYMLKFWNAEIERRLQRLERKSGL